MPASISATQPAQQTARAVLSFAIPAQSAAALGRNPAYVSPGARSALVSIYRVVSGIIATAASTTTAIDFVPSSTCTGTPLVCTIAILAPVGTIAVGVTLYAALGESGPVLATIAPDPAAAFTIGANAQNQLGVALDGVPSSVTIVAIPPSFIAGTPSTVTLSIVARDAAGYTIVGKQPYATPIQIVTGNEAGAILLSSSLFSSPGATVTAVYNGAPLDGPSLGITTSTAGVSLLPAGITIVNTSGILFTVPSVSFLSVAQSAQNVGFSEAFYSGSFTVASNCAGVATVTPSRSSVQLAPLAVGSCAISIADDSGHTGTLPVTVTRTTVGGQ